MLKVLGIFILSILIAAQVAAEQCSGESSEESSGRCKKNERWVECPPSLCVPETCAQLGQPISCPRIAAGRCPVKPACVCIEGYVKNSNGVCIPKKKCPSCGGDRNAEAGCGFLCGKRCDNQNSKPVPCPCEINGCQCKPGFIYDEKVRKCVCPSECSKPKCGINEVYDKCPLECPPRKCGVNIAAVSCIANQTCLPAACRCKDETYRNDQGVCVTWDECPESMCGINEVYDKCPLGCPARECGVNFAAVSCFADQPCLPPGCRCRDETYRNKEGVCVTLEECPPTTEPGPICEEEPTEAPVIVPTGQCPANVQELLTAANANLTGIFLYESFMKKPGENMVMSAFSLLTPIAELAYFAEGETLNQLLRVLNLSSKEHISCAFPPLLNGLTADKNVILNLAVRIFATDSYPLTKKFLDYTRDVFNAQAESLDFSDGQASANRINQWAANATNNRINNIATPDMFSPDTRLVLANALYFLGNWLYQFNENYTQNRTFYLNNDETAIVPTLYQENTFKYGHSDTIGAKFVELFYKGNNFSFFIVLPDDKEGLSDCVQKFKSPDTFYQAYDSTVYQKIRLYLPTMLIENRYDLTDIFNAAGMTDILNPAKSNLKDILEQYEPLFISSAAQKTFCLVNAKGTEAAAVNVITVGTTSVQFPEPEVVDCDHPFIFYIMYNRIPLFSGVFVKPSPAAE